MLRSAHWKQLPLISDSANPPGQAFVGIPAVSGAAQRRLWVSHCTVDGIWRQNLPVARLPSWPYLITVNICFLHATPRRKEVMVWKANCVSYQKPGKCPFSPQTARCFIWYFHCPLCGSRKEEQRSSHTKQVHSQICFIIQAVVSQMYANSFIAQWTHGWLVLMLHLLNPCLSREPVIIIYKKQRDLKGSVVIFTCFNPMSLWYFNRTAAQLKGELGMEDQELLSACARIQCGWGFPALAVPRRADLVL